MANNVLIHSARPENAQQSYTEFDTIDFQMGFEGRAYVPGTFRIEGNLHAVSAGGNRIIPAEERIHLDQHAGAHSFIESLTVETERQGVIETIGNDYPRLVKMQTMATKGTQDLNQADMICELRGSTAKESSEYLKGVAAGCADALPPHGANRPSESVTRASADGLTDVDFSIKPYCAVNRMTGGNLSYEKTGYVRVSVTLARNVQAFSGPGQIDATKYTLSDLKCKFMSVPDSPQQAKAGLVMHSTYSLKGSVPSALTNISTKVPGVCKGVGMSFLPAADNNTLQRKGYACVMPPSMESLQFLFNDSTQNLVTYEIDTINDMLIKGREVFGGDYSTPNQLYTSRLGGDDGFVCGVSFQTLVDLSQQKFNVQVRSGCSNGDTFSAYMYFQLVRQF